MTAVAQTYWSSMHEISTSCNLVSLRPDVRPIIFRGCRELSDAGQATMLDVTETLSQKWERFSDQAVVRGWLKATILPEEHENDLKRKGRAAC